MASILTFHSALKPRWRSTLTCSRCSSPEPLATIFLWGPSAQLPLLQPFTSKHVKYFSYIISAVLKIVANKYFSHILLQKGIANTFSHRGRREILPVLNCWFVPPLADWDFRPTSVSQWTRSSTNHNHSQQTHPLWQLCVAAYLQTNSSHYIRNHAQLQRHQNMTLNLKTRLRKNGMFSISSC